MPRRKLRPRAPVQGAAGGRAGILPFWLSTSRLRSNFVAAEPPGTEDRDQQLRYPGNVGLRVGKMKAQAPLRKPLALVFCDIAGFTHLMAQEGDLVASAFLR